MSTFPFHISEAELTDLENGLDGEAEVRGDYSGRAMYGDHCVAVVGTAGQAMLFAFDLARLLAEREYGDAFGEADGVREMLLEMGGPRVDGMGRSEVWYWPNVVTGEQAQ